MASSVGAAVSNLYDALVVAPALAAVEVTFGHPKLGTQPKEFLSMTGWGSIATEDTVLGGSTQEERYVIKYRGYVWDPSCNGTATELKALVARVLEFYEAVRTVVQDDRTLGGAVNISATVAGAREDESEDTPVQVIDEEGKSAGWYAHTDIRIGCHASIT